MQTEFIVKRLLKLSDENIQKKNNPFSCIIVRNLGDGKKEILAEGVDETHAGNPTKTAVMVTLEKAAQKLNGFKNLNDCEIYLLTYPDPLSLGALYHSTPQKVVFLLTTEEYSKHFKERKKYFDSIESFYEQIPLAWQKRKLPMQHIPDLEGLEAFELRHGKPKERMSSTTVSQEKIPEQK